MRWAASLLAFAALLAGCASVRHHAAILLSPPTARPTAGDYNTIKTAAGARAQALYVERDWRRKAGAAFYALETLMSVHRLTPGRCATYVAGLYGELRDLLDAYPGENWRPLILTVRHDPSPQTACQRPTPALQGAA